MKKRLQRLLSFLLTVVLCLGLAPAPAQAIVPESLGWEFRQFSDDCFRVYKHAAADSAEAERYTGDTIDLSEPVHFYLDISNSNSYSGFALMKLSGPDDPSVPTEGCTVASKGFYELRCSTSTSSGDVYICPSGIFTDGNNQYPDGTRYVGGGMALQYYAGRNALYYPAPGYYRFVYFIRQTKTIAWSEVYRITDTTGLYTGPGGMDVTLCRSGETVPVTRLYNDSVLDGYDYTLPSSTYTLALSGFTLPDGSAVGPDALTVKSIDFLTYSSSWIKSDGSSQDSIVSYQFNEARTVYAPTYTFSDSRALETSSDTVTLRDFTPTYGNEWGSGLNMASKEFDYVYRVKVTADVAGAEQVFYCTSPLTVTWVDKGSHPVDATYISNYPAGTGPADVPDRWETGSWNTVRGANTFAAPEGFRFQGWNSEPDGSGTAYVPGQNVRPEGSMAFYAQWGRASYLVKLPEGMNDIVGTVWITGSYTQNDRTCRDWFWSYSYPEDTNLSGSVFEAPNIPAGRTYTAVEFWACVDGRDTVLARFDGALNDSYTAAFVPLTATDAVYKIYSGVEHSGYPYLEEPRDFTVNCLRCEGGNPLRFPCLLSGERSYTVRVNGVKTSQYYLDYDWDKEWDAAAGWSTLTFKMDKLVTSRTVTGRVSYLQEDTIDPADEPGVAGALITVKQRVGGIDRNLTAVADADGSYTIQVYANDYEISASPGKGRGTGESGWGWSAFRQEAGEDVWNFRVGTTYVKARAELQLTDTEGQRETVERYLTANNGRICLKFYSNDPYANSYLYFDSFTEDTSIGLSTDKLLSQVTLSMSAEGLEPADPVIVPLTNGAGEVTVPVTLSPGVVVRLEAESSSSATYDLYWYRDGEYMGFSESSAFPPVADNSRYQKKNYDFAFRPPVGAGPGEYTLVLIPSSLRNTATVYGVPLSELPEEYICASWENVTLTAGEITAMEDALVTEAASLNALYVTKPRSTLVADRESFSQEAETIRFSGSIGLDTGLTDGKLTKLTLQPERGNCVGFQALVLNGQVYTPKTENIDFERVMFAFDEPVELPADYTLIATSQRSDMDVEFSMTADVTYFDGAANRVSWNHLVGKGLVKRPGAMISTPTSHVAQDKITLTITGASDDYFSSTLYDIYDNGMRIGQVKASGGGATVQVTLQDTSDTYETVHTLQAVSEPADGSEPVSSNELTVTHWANGPQLRKFTMDWDYYHTATNVEHCSINVGDHYSHWSAIGMDNVSFRAEFDNSCNLDALAGWVDSNGDPLLDSNGDPVKVVFKVFTYDGAIRFLPAKEEWGTFTAMICDENGDPLHLPRAVTHAEVLYAPKPGPSGADLEGLESLDGLNVTSFGQEAATITDALEQFRSLITEALEGKTAADSFSLTWDGESVALTGADPTEPGAEMTMLDAFTQTVGDFKDQYSIDLFQYGVAYQSTKTTMDWLDEVIADAANRDEPVEYAVSMMYDGSDTTYFEAEKAAAAALPGVEHASVTVDGVQGDEYVFTDMVLGEDGSVKSCTYYVSFTFLADTAGGTYLSFSSASLGARFAGIPVPAQAQQHVGEAASIQELKSYGGNYTGTSDYQQTKIGGLSGVSAEGGSAAVLGANSSTIDMLNDTSKALQRNSKLTAGGSVVLGVVDTVNGLNDWSRRHSDNHSMYLEMKRFFSTPCFQKLTEGQKQLVQHNFDRFEKAYKLTQNTDMIVTGTNTMVNACSIAATCSGAAAPVGLAISIGGVVVGMIGGAINNHVREEFVKSYEATYNTILRIIRARAYQLDLDDCKGDKDGDGKSFSVCFDPSGIVYEGVIENPVEGATVTLYYAVDAYGNKLKEGQEAQAAGLRLADDVLGLDPPGPVQVTGPNGLYQWFVPEGLWFVVVEYAGRTATSTFDTAALVDVSAAGLTVQGESATALLPVLPPQLDVNIPLDDFSVPAVTSMTYSAEGVQVSFSRYMDEADVLDPANYTLTDAAGTPYTVTAVTPVEQGHVPSNIDPDEPTYTRTVLLAAEIPAGEAMQLTVSGSVKSYAGTPMGSDYADFLVAADTGSLGDAGELLWVYREDGTLGISGRGMGVLTPVYAAAYDENGRMTGLCLFDGSGQVRDIGTGFARCKLFWLDENGQPRCDFAVVK